MSYAWQDEVWKLELSSGAKLVLLALAHRANETGMCYPSVSTIAEYTGMNIKTTRKAILKLEVDGYIRIDRRNRKVSIYHLLDYSSKKLLPKLAVDDAQLLPKTVVPNLVVAESIYSQNREAATPKLGSLLLPKLGEEHINNKSYNKSNIYIAENPDPFTSLKDQIDEAQAEHVIDVQDEPTRILSALEMRNLARINRVNLNITDRLKQVADRQTITTEIFQECVKEFQKTPRSTGWLVGMLDNVSRDPDRMKKKLEDDRATKAFLENFDL